VAPIPLVRVPARNSEFRQERRFAGALSIMGMAINKQVAPTALQTAVSFSIQFQDRCNLSQLLRHFFGPSLQKFASCWYDFWFTHPTLAKKDLLCFHLSLSKD
jgi:hypothetical protein